MQNVKEIVLNCYSVLPCFVMVCDGGILWGISELSEYEAREDGVALYREQHGDCSQADAEDALDGASVYRLVDGEYEYC